MMPTIIWDWNGTLLNDLGLCIDSINALLKKRSLKLLDHASYKEVFSFPVKNYYEIIGFDFTKEDFEIPAKEFIDLYDSSVKNCPLHFSAVEILEFFRQKKYPQFVLSAMKQPMLGKTLKHNGIFHFFEGVAGLNDHYAVSKVERGKELLNEFNIDVQNTWMIGDTDHDFEVARELGIRCILVADGHQSEERLKETGAEVVSSLSELKEKFAEF